jgi:hypothetical protein
MKQEEIDSKLLKINELILENISNLEKYKQISEVLIDKDIKKSSKATIEDWQIQWMKSLRGLGYSYEDIARIVCVNLTVVRYHLIEGEKDKIKKSNQKNREKMKSNPEIWNKYMEYQRNYQRNYQRQKMLKQENKSNENENEQTKNQ